MSEEQLFARVSQALSSLQFKINKFPDRNMISFSYSSLAFGSLQFILRIKPDGVLMYVSLDKGAKIPSTQWRLARRKIAELNDKPALGKLFSQSCVRLN